MTNTKSTHSVEPVVYWTNMAGEMMLAPDTRMKPFDGWMRWECNTVSEIESFSRRFAHQEWEKFRSQKVEEHLRSKVRRDAIRANCELRLAKGCVSQTDEMLTRKTLESLKAKDDLLYKFLATEPDLSKGCLMIEKYEEGKIRQISSGKNRGLRDEEVSLISSLSEATK